MSKFLFLPFILLQFFVSFYAKYFILPPCTVDVMMFGDVSAEEGVIIDEVAVVPTEGGVLIVGVTVDAGKNKMIIFWLTINVNFISYSNNLCKKNFFYLFTIIRSFFSDFIQNTLF